MGALETAAHKFKDELSDEDKAEYARQEQELYATAIPEEREEMDLIGRETQSEFACPWPAPEFVLKDWTVFSSARSVVQDALYAQFHEQAHRLHPDALAGKDRESVEHLRYLVHLKLYDIHALLKQIPLQSPFGSDLPRYVQSFSWLDIRCDLEPGPDFKAALAKDNAEADARGWPRRYF